MKWFGRKAGHRARPFLFAGLRHLFAGEPWPRSYEAQVREGYLSNPVAQRAVRLVAESVAWAPVYAVDENPRRDFAGRGTSRSLVEGTPPPRCARTDAPHRAARSAVPRTASHARSPSPANAGEDFARFVPPALLETVASQLLLHGNAFLQVLLDREAMPAELFPLRPERVSVEADASGWPAAYVYKVGEARSRIAARDGLGRPGLVHLKSVHPLDDHYGLGCLGAAAGAVAVHNAAAKWNKALLDNAARPSGALTYVPDDGAPLSADQFERLRAELEAQFSGAPNAGRPLLLEGGLRWQAMSLTPADMDFVGLKAAAAREIALAFGVPPMLLGLPGDSTYANYREANRALWRLTVLPLADRILAGISAALAAWRPRLRLAVDVDQISALAEDRERLWRQVSAADFLSDGEKRDMLGFAPANDN